jgi:hypothetical protein
MRVAFSLMLLLVAAVAVTGCVTPPPEEVAIAHAPRGIKSPTVARAAAKRPVRKAPRKHTAPTKKSTPTRTPQQLNPML